jgi:hypothetical protein
MVDLALIGIAGAALPASLLTATSFAPAKLEETEIACSVGAPELGSDTESAMPSNPKSIGWAELRFFAMDIYSRNEFMTIKNPGRSSLLTR